MEENRAPLTSLLTSALEARGVLGKIRAELRANVFTAIHDQAGGAAGDKQANAAAAAARNAAADNVATVAVAK